MYSVFEQLLQKRGVTTYRVSKDTGIAQSVFSSWKTGVSNPKPAKLQKIADYFGVSVDYLMTGKEPDEDKYYTNPETAKVAQEIFDNPGLRVLFDAAKDSDPDDLRKAAQLLKVWKGDFDNREDPA